MTCNNIQCLFCNNESNNETRILFWGEFRFGGRGEKKGREIYDREEMGKETEKEGSVKERERKKG